MVNGAQCEQSFRLPGTHLVARGDGARHGAMSLLIGARGDGRRARWVRGANAFFRGFLGKHLRHFIREES